MQYTQEEGGRQILEEKQKKQQSPITNLFAPNTFSLSQEGKVRNIWVLELDRYGFNSFISSLGLNVLIFKMGTVIPES